MKRNAKSVNSSHASRAKRGPAKRTRLAVDERRNAILKAAKALFLKQGYAATSLEQVVAKSGGSLATVYQLFGNKQGLWRALVTEVSEQISAPLLDHSVDVRTTLIEMGLRLVEIDGSPEVAGGIRLIMAEGGGYPELAKTLFEEGPEAGRRLLANYLTAENAADRLSVPDAALAAEQFCCLVGGDRLLRNACGVPKHAPPDQERRRVEAAVDLFLNTYGAKI